MSYTHPTGPTPMTIKMPAELAGVVRRLAQDNRTTVTAVMNIIAYQRFKHILEEPKTVAAEIWLRGNKMAYITKHGFQVPQPPENSDETAVEQETADQNNNESDHGV